MTSNQKKAIPFILLILAIPLAMMITRRKGSEGSTSRARITYDYEPVGRPVAENSEEWQIIRNDKGRLEKIIVKRTVKDLR